MIKSSRLRPLTVALILLAAPFAGAHAEVKPTDTRDEPDSPLHTSMETMGRTFRGLNRGLQTPDPSKKSEYLAALQTIQAAAIEAKQHTPEAIARLPQAEQPAKLTAYRSDLAHAIETMLQLERAILADDWATAQALVKELGAQRKAGHDKYDPEDEKKS